KTDNDDVQTFADLQIASAMAKPNRPVHLLVKREGIAEPFDVTVTPQKDPNTGLLSFGIAPGASTTLISKNEEAADHLKSVLRSTGLAHAGVVPGMRLLSANGKPALTYQHLDQMLEESQGRRVATEWTAVDAAGQPVGVRVAADLGPDAGFQFLQ